MIRFSCFSILCAALVAASPAVAQYRGTPEERAACRPDVLRHCGPEIPNVERITMCLRYYNSINKLSPDCAAVFAEKKR